MNKMKENLVLVPQILLLLGSVNDEARLGNVLLIWQPEIINHAALKYVPLVELNITEGVKTNVLRTVKLAKVAIRVVITPKCYGGK